MLDGVLLSNLRNEVGTRKVTSVLPMGNGFFTWELFLRGSRRPFGAASTIMRSNTSIFGSCYYQVAFYSIPFTIITAKSLIIFQLDTPHSLGTTCSAAFESPLPSLIVRVKSWKHKHSDRGLDFYYGNVKCYFTNAV